MKPEMGSVLKYINGIEISGINNTTNNNEIETPIPIALKIAMKLIAESENLE